MPSVSVVIPCSNVAATIDSALDSAIRQTGIELEIICINDASLDSTHERLTKWKSDGMIKYINSPVILGAGRARNLGLEQACGEFAQFLDGDDVLYPGKLTHQTDILQEHDADFVAGAYEFRNIRGQSSYHHPEPDPWCGLIASRLGRTSSNLFRTSSLKLINGWAEHMKSSQEYELMYRLLMNGGRVAIDDKVLTRLNATRNSISSNNIRENAERFIRLRRQIIGYLKRNNGLTEERNRQYELIYRRTMDEIEKYQLSEV